ncbi:uncharacterized protein LOC128642428 isoform X2 [Bombina bombina]|uniref:uncharacterized protein LOC128642428 isoform X2 n=1 Tax=Bombina bombina TaxID=8345 RepID=UPI00235A9990|nr:uncharacterized protein LOC128642428 isoform X2 [Bombina bombina]
MEQSDRELEVDKSKDGWVLVNAGSTIYQFIYSMISTLWSYLTSYTVGPVLTKKEKFTVSIVTNSFDCDWMEKLLRSAEFNALVDDGITYNSRHLDETIKEKISTCSCIILYYTGDVQNDPEITEVENLYRTPEIKKNVILVVEDKESKKSTNATLNEHMNNVLGSEPISFTNGEIQQCRINLNLPLKGKLDLIKDLMSKGSSESTCRKVVVGIFSRSSGTDYNWLTTHLKSEAFQNLVEDVKPFFISNSNGKEFRNTVAECNFGILYHTKKRGRVNVTDVTDSLYDYELNYMSDILGKRNVIVVVDDLQESSTAEKNRILKSQTSIGELAADIILFTDKERDPNYREPLPTPEDKEGLQKKLLILKELLEKAKDDKDVVENERIRTDSTDQQKRTEQSDQAKSEQEKNVTDSTDEQKGAGECDNDLKTTNV